MRYHIINKDDQLARETNEEKNFKGSVTAQPIKVLKKMN